MAALIRIFVNNAWASLTPFSELSEQADINWYIFYFIWLLFIAELNFLSNWLFQWKLGASFLHLYDLLGPKQFKNLQEVFSQVMISQWSLISVCGLTKKGVILL